MARLNILKLNIWSGIKTHEGGPAKRISPELQLRRSVLACLLWEDQFYEDGVEIGGRIRELVPQVAAQKVSAIAIEARERMKLRHAPVLVLTACRRLCVVSGDIQQEDASSNYAVKHESSLVGLAPQ